MIVLLTILSVIAAWLLLLVLIFSLIRIVQRLEDVRAHLRQIAMGVRAIEQQGAPLAPSSSLLVAGLLETGRDLESASRRLEGIGPGLGGVTRALRKR